MKYIPEEKTGYQMHIISHTHWDREWYLTFEEFRIRLVDMVDHLLKVLDNEPEFRFMLDGQTVVLEDYLEIRPENRAKLRKHIKEGRILVGPWYVLSDERLVSGESLIRNLLLGHRVAEGFGGVMKVGYLPDIFGHIAQMPQILRGFEIDNFIGFRGIKSKKTEFLWDAPDGSRVLAILLPDGYCNFHTLPDDINLAMEEVAKAKRSLSPRSVTGHLILMNGCDHLGPQSNLPGKVRELNKLLRKNKFLKDDKLILSTLPEYIRKIKKVTAELKIFRGELKDPVYRYVHSSGVLATRIYIKQENENVTTLLEKWAEPFSSIMWTLGGSYPQSLIRQSWKYLLRNQAHDSICGCSIDSVHREMMGRFTKSKEIANEIIQRALNDIAGKIDTSHSEENGKSIVVFNPLNRKRTDVVDVIIDIPVKEGKASFASANDCTQESPINEAATNGCSFLLKDVHDKVIPHQAEYLGIDTKLIPVEPVSRIHPRRFAADRWKVTFIAEDVPACGYKLYGVKINAAFQKRDTDKSLVSHSNVLENEYLKATIENNGTLTIIDKETGNIYRNCNLFEDGGDGGDEFDYSPPPEDNVSCSTNLKASISPVENGPVRVTYKVKTKLNLPVGLTRDRKSRSEQLVKCEIISFVSLAGKSRRVDIITHFDNRAKDHRLRVLFPSGIDAGFAYAEGQFAVIKRKIELTKKNRDYKWEMPLGLHPQQSFVSINNREKGLTIANRGLPQYGISNDGQGIIALTLLRSVGWFRQEGLLTAKRLKGDSHTPTPGAQCPGRHTFDYSIIPHSKSWKQAKTYKEAHNFKVPLRAVITGKHGGELPEKMSFVSIGPENLIISTIKKAERDNSLIIRCYNTSDRETRGYLSVCRPVREANLVNLNEERIKSLEVRGENFLPIRVGGNKIITIELKFLK